jgi:hypothetical protein
MRTNLLGGIRRMWFRNAHIAMAGPQVADSFLGWTPTIGSHTPKMRPHATPPAPDGRHHDNQGWTHRHASGPWRLPRVSMAGSRGGM